MFGIQRMHVARVAFLVFSGWLLLTIKTPLSDYYNKHSTSAEILSMLGVLLFVGVIAAILIVQPSRVIVVIALIVGGIGLLFLSHLHLASVFLLIITIVAILVTCLLIFLICICTYGSAE